MRITRGDIFFANLSPVVGCEQGGVRPVVVIQNEKGNRFSHTIIIAPISTRFSKPPLPTHVILPDAALQERSMVLCEQIRTIDKQRLIKWVCTLDKNVMGGIDHALQISLGL